MEAILMRGRERKRLVVLSQVGAETEPQTQFGRGMAQLGVRVILARSPQDLDLRRVLAVHEERVVQTLAEKFATVWGRDRPPLAYRSTRLKSSKLHITPPRR